MNIVTAFIADSQPTKLVQPGKCSLDYPAKYTKAATVFRSAFGQNRIYTQVTQGLAMRLAIVCPVALNTIRSLTGTTHFTCDRRNRLYQWQKLGDIMTVCSSYFHRKRDTVGISYKVMFRPQFPSIRCIRARFRPPKTARTEAESTTAREKSILSFFRRWLSRIRCILSQTPAFCQSCRRRQQVMPDPQPISLGKYCQGIPVLSTKIIPVRALRSSTGGLPPLGRGGCFGMTGSMSFHNWSFTSGLAMCWSSMIIYRILGFPTHVLSDKPLFKF
jgi:hypothetical protein